jgi:adenylate cyclase
MVATYQRRVASVLSADVVGYSRLIAQNDERTVTILRSCRQVVYDIVRKHNGRVFGSAGDSFMIECASPIDAVLCAAEIQGVLWKRNKALPKEQQMWLRTGVSVGEAIDEDGVLHGEHVNIAARLQEACPTGGIVVSEQVHAQVAGKVDFGFRPLGELMLKNIPRQFQILEVITDQAGMPESAPALSIIDVSQPIPGFGGRAALAVLPLEIKDPEGAYLADGFSEELVTALSNLRWLPIIDRNSSFAFRGAIRDPRRIGKLLGARYLLGGNLRVKGDRLRVITRLVESEAAHILWSARYDVRLADILTTLDEAAASIAGTLEGRIEQAEQVRARAKRRSRLDLWELIWRGRWHLNRLTRADADEARRLFDEALAQDPHSAEALIHLAWWTFYDIWTQRRSREHVVAFKELSLRALKADELDGRGHLLAGCAEILLRNPDAALRHLNEAIRLNPSLAYAHAQIGSSQMLAGRPQDAIAPLKKSLRLNPHDHYVFYVLGELAAVHYMLGEWQEAIALAEKSLEVRQAYWHARMSKIGALARSGKRQQASQELEILFAKHPNFSTKYIDWLPFEDRRWIDYFAEGLALADSRAVLMRDGEHVGTNAVR